MKQDNIYTKLVEDKYDIVGHVAYSLYVEDKRKYTDSFIEKQQKEPTQEDLHKFEESVSMDTCVERYKMEAEKIINTFLSYVLDETTKRIEKDCIKNHEDILKGIISPLEPESMSKRYFHAIVQSILGAFFFALIAAAFMFIKSYS